MRETSKDKTRLLHIIEAIDNINEFKKDVSYENFVEKSIINMRHVIVHGYYQIDADILWDTINNDLAELKQAVEKYLSLSL